MINSYDNIKKEDGRFDPAMRQVNQSGAVISNLDELLSVGKEAKEVYEKFLKSLLESLNLDESMLHIAPLKAEKRCIEKARDDYSSRECGPAESWLYDIVRGTIICETEQEISDVVSALEKSKSVIRMKNRFKKPTPGGFRDINMNVRVQVTATCSHICELQIHCRAIKDKGVELHSHEVYEFFRSYFKGSTETVDKRLQLVSSFQEHLKEGDNALEECVRSVIGTDSVEKMENLVELLGYMSELQSCLTVREALYKAKEAAALRELYEIGRIYETLADYETSLKKLEECLALQKKLLGELNADVLRTSRWVGWEYLRLKDYNKSINVLSEQ